MAKLNDCIENAAKAFKGAFEKEEINEIAHSIDEALKKAKSESADAAAILQKLEESSADAKEIFLKEKEIKALNLIQSKSNIIGRILSFVRGGFESSRKKAIDSYITGSAYSGIEGTRESTDNYMNTARNKTLSKIINYLNRNNLWPFFTTSDSEIKIADAILARNKGQILDTPHGKIANLIYKVNNEFLRALRRSGELIPRNENRIITTIHDSDKLTTLTSEEIDEALKGVDLNNKTAVENAKYQYAFNRWYKFKMPLLDKKKTFTDRDIDINNENEVLDIMKDIFEKLSNTGKDYSDLSKSYVNRLKAARFFWHKDAESAVVYNRRYGNGSLQEALVSQLANGFSFLELVKDWGFNPLETLKQIYKLTDKIPEIRETFNKAEDFEENKKKLNALVYGVNTTLTGKYAQILNISRSIAVAKHLFLVTPRSLSDVQGFYNLAKSLNIPFFSFVGKTIRNFAIGLSEKDKAIISDSWDIQGKIHNGSINHMFVADETSTGGKQPQIINKFLSLVGLHRWDNSVRMSTLAGIGRHFQVNKDIHWDSLDKDSKEIFQKYALNKLHWEVLRKSGLAAVSGKKIIMPDNVQYMSNDTIRKIAKENGSSNLSDNEIQDLKDEIERKFDAYMSDRMDHLIIRPDVKDRLYLNFNNPKPTEGIQFLYHILTTFRGYSVAWTRKHILPALYSNGARNLQEAFFSGKNGLLPLAGLVFRMGLTSYITLSLLNLLRGYSPPALNHSGTIKNIFQDALGFFDMALDISPTDMTSTLGKFAMGAIPSDIQSIARIGKGGFQWANGQGPTKFEGALFQFSNQYSPVFNWILDPLTAHAFYDTFDPVGYNKDVSRMQQNYGSAPLPFLTTGR